MHRIVKEIENKILNDNVLKFKSGDTIIVNMNILDNDGKIRKLNYEGIIISIKNAGINTKYTVRKISYGEGVEFTFFIFNPSINSIKIKRYGQVRKSKIYYIRQFKNTKVKEKLF
jgi:large subunit ribosomal protein L19